MTNQTLMIPISNKQHLHPPLVKEWRNESRTPSSTKNTNPIQQLHGKSVNVKMCQHQRRRSGLKIHYYQTTTPLGILWHHPLVGWSQT
jgi:hypothetical protein